MSTTTPSSPDPQTVTSFDGHEERWFARGATVTRPSMRPAPMPLATQGIGDRVADVWFKRCP